MLACLWFVVGFIEHVYREEDKITLVHVVEPPHLPLLAGEMLCYFDLNYGRGHSYKFPLSSFDETTGYIVNLLGFTL